jgi:tRNA-Thr(GGU) m(6)t(6)A37 methyltransferase TsaA
MSHPVVQLQALGVIRTPHQDPDQTPIQPCFAEGIQGEIQLDPAYQEGLDGLKGFSHAFLLYHLHKAEPGALRVKPFLLDDTKGVFACRFPNRPNSLGMSLVKLLAIEGCRVAFEGADMLDGTPLLDIKPYYPKADAPEAAWGGWTEQVDPNTARQIGSRQRAALQGVCLVPSGTYFRNDRLPSLPLD